MLRIGLTLYWDANPDDRAEIYGPWKFSLNQCYMKLFEGLGVVPLGLLPGGACTPSERIRELDGLVLTGGGDPAPVMYGRADRGSRNPETDRPMWDLCLYREARAAGIPVLAICLGMQLAAISEGGALIQDIPSSVPGALDHGAGLHAVHLREGSGLSRLLGARASVWSSHHQAVESVPAGFIEAGRSPDGIIEAMESDDGLVTAVQWHPERDATGPVIAAEFARTAREMS